MKIFDPLYTAVSWVILKLHDGFISMGMSQSWAWSLGIVGLVMLIRIALIPLFVKQIRSMRNMQVLQPEIKKIQERYKGDRERISQELMKLYKEHNTNPLASCLPVLAQSPFFLSLYRVLSKISGGHPIGVIKGPDVESAKSATFLGAHLSDKFVGAHSLSVQAVTVIMIVAMCGSQFYTQRQLMTKNMPKDTGGTPNAFMQQQKVMMYLFPVMFAVFGINFPVGVLIYWLVSNFWSMGQQLYVIRRMPAVGSPAHDAMVRRKGGSSGEDGGGSGGGGFFAKRPQKPSASPNGNGAAPTPDAVEAPAAKPVRQQPQRQARSQRGGGGKKR